MACDFVEWQKPPRVRILGGFFCAGLPSSSTQICQTVANPLLSPLGYGNPFTFARRAKA